jgi:catechol 2,3-dioxygenase-like lactoylglutathione lyase family enzyme
MSLVPTVRCSRIEASIAFYTQLLDFEDVDEGDLEDPGFRVLKRGADLLFLSSHAGDGAFGQAMVVLVDDVDEIVRSLRIRGLTVPEDRHSPVHEGPVDQSWGTREFYVDDPDGNTVRFVQGIRAKFR